jgi:hypothetical protein
VTSGTRPSSSVHVQKGLAVMLIGAFVGWACAFVIFEWRGTAMAKEEATRAVYATTSSDKVEPGPLPPGWVPVNSIRVPLSTGIQLYVADCDQLHPPVFAHQMKATRRLPGATNGHDCYYFPNDFSDFGPHLLAVPLGNEYQIAIEKDYWAAYFSAKREFRREHARALVYCSILGFAAVLFSYRLWLRRPGANRPTRPDSTLSGNAPAAS